MIRQVTIGIKLPVRHNLRNNRGLAMCFDLLFAAHVRTFSPAVRC